MGPTANVGVAHPGTQHSWETALAFQEADRLRWYATSSFYIPDRWPDRGLQWAPPAIREKLESELNRRRDNRLKGHLIRRNLAAEPLERILRTRGAARWADWLLQKRHSQFPLRVIRRLEKEPVETLWGPYDLLEAFEWAKKRGINCVLDQPIGHLAALNRVLSAERAVHPEFFNPDSAWVSQERIERQRRAADVADLIVLGSDFASNTMELEGVTPSKLRVVPYGFSEPSYLSSSRLRAVSPGAPIEFLFVGSVGARKGIAYLLKAFEAIDPSLATLTIVGPLDMPRSTFQRYARGVNYVGQVRRAEVREHLERAHCFILPSLFEGSALVLYEAMAAGLGLIQTKECGGPMVGEGNGNLVPSGDTDAIVRAVEEVVANPHLISQWSAVSLSVRARYGWSTYRQAVVALVTFPNAGDLSQLR